MRILILQIAPDTRGRPVPRFEPQLGTLLALLERREHELALEGLARFDLPRTKAALARSLPQLVYADISPVCVDAARRTLEYIEQHEFLPIVAGGAYATIAPRETLSLPGVHAAAIGEPDASLVTYFERMKDPAVTQVVSGVWLRDERGLEQPELPELVEDLGSLPFAHRDLFGYAEHIRGTGRIEIAVGRGCEQRCTYWPFELFERLYAGRGTWVRRRSPANVLAEIAQLRENHSGVRHVRFLDPGFALDEAWLSDFLEAYPRQCGLPFRCHLRANATTEALIHSLAGAGCRAIDVDVISGSDFIRNEVFEMDLSEKQIRRTFAAAEHEGIRTRATTFLGAPYESEASLDATRRLLLDLRPDVADVRAYYPFPGTRARDLCQEQGWLHPRGEECYHQGRCGVDIPACRPEIVASFIRRLRAELPGETDRTWWQRWSAASRNALEQVFQRRR